MNTIDYSVLADSQYFYEQAGYRTIEVPWRVSEEMIKVTRPPYVTQTDYRIEGTNKALIASGEQGFIYLMNKGFLPPGKYQTITPCFRNEQYDFTHSKQFMKLELIIVLERDASVVMADVFNIADLARRNMIARDSSIDNRLTISNVSTDDPLMMPHTNQVDLFCNTGLNEDGGHEWIELGSYGARTAQFGSWIYGTGVAEPRFSKTCELVQRRMG
jgi:hypothetical protein